VRKAWVSPKPLRSDCESFGVSLPASTSSCAGVLTELAVKLIAGVVPVAERIGVIGVLALIANAVCLALLWRRRTGDVNMRSAWTCSLNDVAGNVGVLVAGAGVELTGRAWPDIVVGLGIAALFVTSAVGVIRDAGRHLRAGPAA
jgi:Co/Zn/Cd efflux system component